MKPDFPVFPGFAQHLHGQILRGGFHECLLLGVGDAPCPIIFKFRPIVVIAGIEDAVFSNNITGEAPGRDAVGPAQSHEEVHELSAVSVFVPESVQSSQFIALVAGITKVSRNPIESICGSERGCPGCQLSGYGFDFGSFRFDKPFGLEV